MIILDIFTPTEITQSQKKKNLAENEPSEESGA